MKSEDLSQLESKKQESVKAVSIKAQQKKRNQKANAKKNVKESTSNSNDNSSNV